MTWLSVVIFAAGFGFGAVAIVTWRRAHQRVWEQMGLDLRHGVGQELVAGLVISTIAMVGIFCVMRVFGLVRVSGVQFPLLAILETVGLLVLSGLGEELFFRSLMLNGIVLVVRRTWIAITVMAALFGLAHLGNPNATLVSVISNAIGGAMYGIAFLGTRRIWMPFGLHLAWNVVQGPLLGYPVSGLMFPSMVQQQSAGTAWLTGGAYGPEGSLIGIGFRFVVIALVLAVNARHRTACLSYDYVRGAEASGREE